MQKNWYKQRRVRVGMQYIHMPCLNKEKNQHSTRKNGLKKKNWVFLSFTLSQNNVALPIIVKMCFSKCVALERSAAHTKRRVTWFREHFFTIVFKDMLVMPKRAKCYYDRCSSKISHLNVLAHQLTPCSTAINGLQQRIIATSIYCTQQKSV